MSPGKRANCQICNSKESKYTCSTCMVLYCSVPCYKQHKESCSSAPKHPSVPPIGLLEQPRRDTTAPAESSNPKPNAENAALESDIMKSPELPLRPLTSLKWPYVPEESAYPDPLKRDDPKPLQLHQYEAIATSSSVRHALAANPRLPELLRSIDKLRGEEREEALERALGVSPSDVRTPGNAAPGQDAEDVKASRALAEAVEAAVRGGKEDMLGLDWGD